MKSVAHRPARGRWRRALAALALMAVPAPAFAGVDDQPLVVDGPWIIEVGPEVAVIAGPQGNFAIVGDATGSARACEATVGCAAILDEGVGAVVIVDQSPVTSAPASPTAASPPSGTGAAPR